MMKGTRLVVKTVTIRDRSIEVETNKGQVNLWEGLSGGDPKLLELEELVNCVKEKVRPLVLEALAATMKVQQ